ncbi:MAG: DUF1080 domain-containing protein [Planctomycetes bacterium]|nr:DUF1080 domain-containing protein [Planctomycetota bacterium]
MRYATLTLAMFMLAGCASAQAEDAKWTPLFNGRDLTGWTVKSVPKDKDKGFWKVQDGLIVCDSIGHKDHDYFWLVSDGEYDNFELRLKVRSFRDSPGNSGVQVRSRYDDEAGWLDGPQVDIHPPGPWRCGFIYDETRGVNVWLWPNVGKPANAKPEHAPPGWHWRHADEGDGWNSVVIRCDRYRITTQVNGVNVADLDGKGILDDEKHAARHVGMTGRIALQLHRGDELHIAFKDIEIRKLP